MSLVPNIESASIHAFWNDRIVADFRNFRFTWAGFARWAGIVVAALLIAIVITLYFLDWNEMRAPISRYASHRFDRPIRIEGDLKIDLFRSPERSFSLLVHLPDLFRIILVEDLTRSGWTRLTS